MVLLAFAFMAASLANQSALRHPISGRRPIARMPQLPLTYIAMKPQRRPGVLFAAFRGAVQHGLRLLGERVTMTALEDIRTLERGRISAMLKGDHQSIAQYLDQDLIYVHSTGQVDGMESYLASLRDGKYVYEKIEVIEERHAEGTDFVVLLQILSVVIRVAGAGAALPRQVAASSLWRRSQGQWKLVTMQATPRPA